jgi:CRISPR-associated protein Cas1
MKDRVSVVYLERGELDVLDGAFVLVDKNGVRAQIPVGMIGCLMLEPGTRVSHAAVTLAARVGCLLVWTGEAGVRVYSAGRPGGARSDRLLYQARLALDPEARMKVVRKMYAMRFKEEPPAGYSADQLRTLEGQRVRALYQLLAKQYGVAWTARQYNPKDWDGSDTVNLCLSAATACLYGVTEAAVLAAGYSPAIGFLHSGKPLSFVYDIADLFKFDTVVQAAFQVAAKEPPNADRAVRLLCRDAFRRSRILYKIIPAIDEVLAAGGMDVPEAPPEAQPIAIPDDTDLEEA